MNRVRQLLDDVVDFAVWFWTALFGLGIVLAMLAVAALVLFVAARWLLP